MAAANSGSKDKIPQVLNSLVRDILALPEIKFSPKNKKKEIEEINTALEQENYSQVLASLRKLGFQSRVSDDQFQALLNLGALMRDNRNMLHFFDFKKDPFSKLLNVWRGLNVSESILQTMRGKLEPVFNSNIDLLFSELNKNRQQSLQHVKKYIEEKRSINLGEVFRDFIPREISIKNSVTTLSINNEAQLTQELNSIANVQIARERKSDDPNNQTAKVEFQKAVNDCAKLLSLEVEFQTPIEKPILSRTVTTVELLQMRRGGIPMDARQKVILAGLKEVFSLYNSQDPSLSVKKFANVLRDAIDEWNIPNTKEAKERLVRDFISAFDRYRQEFKNDAAKLVIVDECLRHCEEALTNVNVDALKSWETKAAEKGVKAVSWTRAFLLFGAAGGGLAALLLNPVIGAATFGVSVGISAVLAMLGGLKSKPAPSLSVSAPMQPYSPPRPKRRPPPPPPIHAAKEKLGQAQTEQSTLARPAEKMPRS